MEWTRRGILAVAAVLLVGISAATAEPTGEVARKLAAVGLDASRAVDANGIYNEHVAVLISLDSARFNFGAYPAGGSGLAGSNSYNMSFAWPSSPGTSYTTIRIDGVNHIFGSGGRFAQPVTIAADQAVAVWQPLTDTDTIEVTQRLSLVNGPSTGQPDTILIAYDLINQDSVPHTVGVRFMMDTMLNGNDAAPFRIPGVGDVTTEQLFSGDAVPSYWQAFNNLAEAGIASQGTLAGFGAVRPDRFATARWGVVSGSEWDFTPSGLGTGDSAVALWWDEVTLAPGQRLHCATLYGLSQQAVTVGHLLLGVTSPAVLDLAQMADIEVVAQVENPGSDAAPGVTLDLVLSEALRLVGDGRVVSTVEIGDLAPRQSGQASWRIGAAPGTADGTYLFEVVARSTSPSITPVRQQRQVQVRGSSAQPDPGGQPVTFEYDLPPGLSLIGFPLATIDSIDGDFTGLQSLAWLPAEGTYVPFSPFAGLLPRDRHGAFVYNPSSQSRPLAVSGNALPADGEGRRQLPLALGWNLVPNPTTGPLRWDLDRIEVLLNGAPVGLLSDRATWLLVRPYGWLYEAGAYRLLFDSTLPGFAGAADTVPALAGLWLQRTGGQGDLALRFGGSAVARATGAAGNGWAVALQAATETGEQAEVTVGIVPGLTRALPIALPPGGAESALLSLVTSAGAAAGELAPAGGALSWEVNVAGRAAGPVTLTWPGLGRGLPAGWQAVLTDLATGQRTALRWRSSYQIPAGERGRTFRLELSRSATASLQLQVRAEPSRAAGCAVTVQVTAPARLELRVTSLTGRLVRQLTAVADGPGAVALAWDGLDASGRRAPAGVYRLQVTASGDDGRTVRADRTVTLH